MQYYNHKTQVYLNGKFVYAADTGVDLFSQTLHYGYGVFEGLRAYNTHNGVRIFKAEEHFDRLQQSCRALSIDYKWNNRRLIEDTYHLLELNHLRNAYIRPLVYCGPNMKLSHPGEPHLMIAAWEWSAVLGERLLRLCTSNYQRHNPNSIHTEAKVTGHYVTSILASNDAKQRGYDEALLLDHQQYIAQTSGANFFLERNGKLFTPATGNIFPGITRQTVIGICRQLGIELVEKQLTLNDVRNGTSAFLCGTATEIVGVGSIDHITFETDWEDSIGATIKRFYRNLVLEKENYEVII
ncbi:branched-chain-amino-acid transaminase [Pedobacter sp. BS3]|uniref:branched-chain-amino-acid transaminase n=1 Tax=Pedobacter sp. BS3 TaxID=2567937 RepID=UPI0011EC9796|nr:branched-chain-amino-acid transaminase [Pedobacter sp. BS3]TZF83135.1 branched-chain-amino-acid transaminase [Pedobacter sp. BS3]